MGFETSLFLEKPSEELICPICMGVFDDPVLDECDHVFCRSCLVKWLKNKRTCPLSNEPCSPNKLRKIPLTFRGLIGSLKIKCVGCEKNYVELDQRQTGCPDCYIALQANRPPVEHIDSDDSSSSASHKASSSQSQSQVQSEGLNDDWLNLACVATAGAVVGAGLVAITSSMKHKSRNSKK